eukprot:c1016_g1_i1.p1 GENE.c1016_g1_i1~~c1016_g1_i1.p1  ORF type:complete len:259 (+),score=53.19 c1016_g1_i1:1-777(+)
MGENTFHTDEMTTPTRLPSPDEHVKTVLPVPSSSLGKIIGRGGATIRSLQDESGASITVDKAQQNSVTISGPPESVQKAVQLITALVSAQPTNQASNSSQPEHQEVVEVSAAAVGRVIGRGGETVKSIQHTSNARIQVKQDDGSDVRRVIVSGTRDQVNHATRLINDILAQQQQASQNPRQSQQFSAESVHEFDIEKSVVGRLIGKGGETVRRIQGTSGARVQIDQHKLKVKLSGSKQAVDSAKALVQEVLDQSDAQQ